MYQLRLFDVDEHCLIRVDPAEMMWRIQFALDPITDYGRFACWRP